MESNQVNLEQLWAIPRVEHSDIREVYQSIDTYRLKKVKMNWALAIIGVFSIGWIIGINVLLKGTVFYGSIWVVLGSVICVLAMTMFMTSYYRLNGLIPSSILTQTTSDYIVLLTKEKKQQLQLSKVWMNVYILLFIVGIAIYSYPFIDMVDTAISAGYYVVLVGYYAVLGIWAGVNMYWNKKINSKKIVKLEQMIKALQAIQ
ncbi:hypothetical protein [Myroides odoratimimus]|uniref:hypothetical protein n=1 Tax=Myroides odoratimimus TaxID=76832 RepID=UPI00218061EF|nr:hypothetical protein [Myroides odoratimimus]MCS7474692.1 hypothetical protein [Myroides odoratimimus]